MSLGLYVSSFHFFHSGKRGSSNLGLKNHPIRYNIRYKNTQYSHAIARLLTK